MKSHPDKLLVDHLLGVKRWGEHYMNLSPCKLIEKETDKELLDSFLLLHDIGKATAYFQDYIDGKPVDIELKSHALLSAIIFFEYNVRNHKIDKYENTIRLMFMAILRHHGDLTTIKQCLDSSIVEDELLEKQWNSIDKDNLMKVFIKCGLNSAICRLSFEEFNCNKTIRMKWAIRCRKSNELTNDFTDYLLLQNLYSLLLDADKSDVAIQNIETVKNVKYDVDIREYIKSKCKLTNPLAKMRSEAFNEAEYKLKQNINERIFTLTLPTGMGKTLNALNCAFELRKKLMEEQQIDFKIIYSLPFMSIIDQTTEEAENILNKKNDNVGDDILLKHHHLAEIKWNHEEEPQIAKMLIEGWNSQIIITTFIQLFQTLIGYRNSSQRKFAKMNNAIIIVDEIQSLPVKYYKLIRNLLLEFTKNTNSRFIIMTATQPKILGENEHVKLCDSRMYYKSLERTLLINSIENKQTIEQLIEDFECEENKSYLFILNTINASKKLYELLEQKYPNKKILLLNTNFPPYIRKECIKKIKQKEYDVVVSTQLVEAGVDIDMDVVYRDLAPLPNILQSAGRANREALNKGKVYMINLINNNGREYSTMIYDDIDISLTKEVLKDKKSILENEFIDIIDSYYEYISDGRFKSQDTSAKLIRGLNMCKCSGAKSNTDVLYAEDFKIIEENGNAISIYIELNEKASELWMEYCNIREANIENVWEKHAMLSKINRKMAEFIVTVRVNKELLKNNLPPKVNEYYYVSKDDIEYYYSNKYGFGNSDTIFI